MLDFPRWKRLWIWGLLLFGVLIAIPSLMPERVAQRIGLGGMPRINLGLDLSGGSHLLLEADTDDLLRQNLRRMEEAVQAEMRRGSPRIGIGDISTAGGRLSFFVRDVAQLDAGVERLRTLTQPTGLSGERDWTVQVVNSTRIVMTPTQSGLAAATNSAMDVATEVVRKRIDELGTREPTIVREGPRRILVQVPGLENPDSLKALLGRTARLEFKLVAIDADPSLVAQGRAPAGAQIVPYPDNPGGVPVIAVQRRVVISGDDLIDAQLTQDENNQPAVSIKFNAAGGRKFARVTQENTGKPFAMILDNSVLSAPNINEPILGGNAIINGNFSTDSANQLAIALRSGKLPVALKVIEQGTVGAGLGADSIRAGVVASIVATVAVVVFMLVTYGRFGFYANCAVVLNIFVIVGVMAILGATLTLPGIAGFVLTIGTAVDANVLINERIREERRRGRSILQSVEFGYKEASRTIFEANVTHAIAGIIMLLLGSGPVKGFAIVLLIGIATSVFTAVLFTRMLVVGWLRRRRPTEIVIEPESDPMRLLKLVPDNTNLPFVSLRYWAFGLTALLTVLAIGAVAMKGLNMGVDFVGGVMVEAQFPTAPSLDRIRDDIARLDVGEVQLQQVGSANGVQIRLPVPDSEDEGASAQLVSRVEAALKADFPGVTFSQQQSVSGKVSGELVRNGVLAVFLAIFGIAIFSWLRYEWQFGVSTFVAIAHDVLMTLGFFAVTRLEFDLNIVAAVLTIVGYSINDKMVIDDRIRENMRKYRQMDMRALIDLSVNETLPRTVMTSITILLALGSLLVLGGHVLRGFTAAMMLGIVVGTYSSVYVSSSLLITLGLKPHPTDRKPAGPVAGAERIG